MESCTHVKVNNLISKHTFVGNFCILFNADQKKTSYSWVNKNEFILKEKAVEIYEDLQQPFLSEIASMLI